VRLKEDADGMSPGESGPPPWLRVDAETTLELRDASHKIDADYRNDHFGRYDYVRAVMSKIVAGGHFYIDFFHGEPRPLPVRLRQRDVHRSGVAHPRSSPPGC
jgi:hypothetical protein